MYYNCHQQCPASKPKPDFPIFEWIAGKGGSESLIYQQRFIPGNGMPEKIAEYLERRAYGNPGQKEKKLSRARLIFSVTPELHMHMNKELLTQIPVVCDIPSLQNRRPDEKEMLIMKFFRDEEEALKRDIQVSSQVFQALMDYLFQENISQLKNCIKVICANAFFRQENEKKMKALLYHLPESMLAQTDLELLKEDNTFLDI